jgi:hypothetical protein
MLESIRSVREFYGPELFFAGKSSSSQVCPECHSEPHDVDALYRKYCGTKLLEGENSGGRLK